MTITRLAWVLLPVCIVGFAPAPRSTAAWLRRAPVARAQADTEVPSLDDAPSDGSVRMEDGPLDATAVLTFALTGEQTRLAMRAAATHIANTTTIDGWRKSDAKKVPPEVVGAVVGKLALHKCCLDVLLEGEVTKAIERSGIKAIGQPALVGDKDVYAADKLTAGEPLALKIVVDVYPTAVFPEGSTYTGLSVEVFEEPPDSEKTRKAIANLQNRYVDLLDAPDGHAAELGDVVVIDMEGFGVGDDGKPAEPLPAVAGGDDVEVHLEAGQFMPGMVEGLVGAAPGELREIRVTFPPHVREPSLANKAAIFKTTVKAVKTRAMPALDDAFADKIRPGLTWKELEAEVEAAVNQEAQDKTKENRDAELATALRARAEIAIPSTLLVEQAREKFAAMMAEFRDQGVGDEELRKLVTKERFEQFLARNKDSVKEQITDGMVVETIAGLEGIKPPDEEVEEQLQNMLAQMRQKNEDTSGIDEEATRVKIFQALQKDQVMQWVAEQSEIKYKPKPKEAKADA